jgi:hypothetical protein
MINNYLAHIVERATAATRARLVSTIRDECVVDLANNISAIGSGLNASSNASRANAGCLVQKKAKTRTRDAVAL